MSKEFDERKMEENETGKGGGNVRVREDLRKERRVRVRDLKFKEVEEEKKRKE